MLPEFTAALRRARARSARQDRLVGRIIQIGNTGTTATGSRRRSKTSKNTVPEGGFSGGEGRAGAGPSDQA